MINTIPKYSIQVLNNENNNKIKLELILEYTLYNELEIVDYNIKTNETDTTDNKTDTTYNKTDTTDNKNRIQHTIKQNTTYNKTEYNIQ